MYNNYFLEEFFTRLQNSKSDDIIRTVDNGIVTDSEDVSYAIPCIMRLLGLSEFVNMNIVETDSAEEYHFTYDAEASKPEQLRTDGKRYQVVFSYGKLESERYGYDDIEDACARAFKLDADRGCDQAEVYRLNDEGEYYSIFWCDSDGMFQNWLDEDDPDFQTVEDGYENDFMEL